MVKKSAAEEEYNLDPVELNELEQVSKKDYQPVVKKQEQQPQQVEADGKLNLSSTEAD